MDYKISKAVMDKIEIDSAESYINPISLVMTKMAEMVSKEIDNNMMVSVNQTIGFNVDKEELIKALKYDREQYDKGYMDASRKYASLLEKATPKKTIMQDITPYHEFCSVCGGLVFDSHNYCCKCGQALDWSE